MNNELPTSPVPQFTQERAFLLRSWRDSQGRWLFNIQPIVENSRRIGFPTLEDLLRFLEKTFPSETFHDIER